MIKIKALTGFNTAVYSNEFQIMASIVNDVVFLRLEGRVCQGYDNNNLGNPSTPELCASLIKA